MTYTLGVRTTIVLDDDADAASAGTLNAEPYRVPIFRGIAPMPGLDLNSNAALAEILETTPSCVSRRTVAR